MFKGKKGINRTIIIYAILMLIFLSFFIYLFTEVSVSTERYNTEQVCRNSVRIAAYKISGESVYENLKCPTQYETIEATDDETIKYEIAERMRKCYWMFWEGRYELFEEESENFCVICYVLEFEEKKKITGFMNYLVTHNLPMAPDMKYYDYLTPYSTTQELIDQTTTIEKDFIDTNQKYSIMFNYIKPGYLSKLEAGKIGVGAGAAAGAVPLILINIIPYVNIVTIPATVIAGAGLAGGATGFYFGWGKGETADWAASIMLWPYTEEEVTRIQCQYAPAETK